MALHTDIPTRAEVEGLLAARDATCVSIYLPTSSLPQEAQANRLELKNLAAEAVAQLEAADAERREVAQVRDALDDLIDDEAFWAEQARSLAVFASPSSLRTFRLPNRLAAGVEVGDRFYVKPLLRALTFPQAAFVLALAAGSVRLIEVTSEGPPFPVDVPGLPTDLESAVGAPPDHERSMRARLRGDEGQKVRLRQFARQVDQALRGVLAGLDLPLILAATDPLDSIYRSVQSYPGLVDESIPGSPEAVSESELAAAARPVLDRVYATQLAALRERFDLRAGQDRTATDVAQVARAATFGAVDTLLVDIDQKVPGTVDEATGAVTFGDDDAASYGVVDEIARRVFLSGGRVLAVRADDLPGGVPLAAILRYTV